ncbi:MULTISPECIES: thiosulfate ABC transporter substrate-binding protein CysP [unclassified Salinivibrio]|uniref:thiosulfate ABC transporter substrate-binding protein CysP n=1 Tax=unclassified Salinivibrio TaxID=2636825 RepID=UPI00128BF027|nr:MULTISPECIES: thiosulfate ABC transporter substrate-binding protein CysP [unclassified Salinivibrio]MPS31059.1 sulfate ABC transporter substrate-binding protein [Salinivibrio sp. VYel7]MPX89404.1 sulfate ABC transporter substrate-binding protein [Salinivibrio sp. VYel1]MPX92460.1 sulfate ABC transporter substrate-binding protein [Salinivibrio sp. VYel9]MPX97630.1 sulfate ABC transporter substrate-binding protein [Salinivibrio sp. VYel6]MPX98692.1 sulfate ABC transporter substrate-binding pr
MKVFKTLALSALLATSAAPVSAAEQTLLNSSYDIARELFADYNPLFAAHWQEKTGESVTIKQSHGGSSAQARAIMQGLQADVVTFNQVTDVQVLYDRGKLIDKNWKENFPNSSSPYYSTTAFLVRKGNPKNIENWDDLAKDDVASVFPNPKTSGNARYTYLAALGYAQKAFGKDNTEQQDQFLKQLLANVAVFDTGGRGATTSFVERGIGDVLVTFESEVNNIRQQYGSDKYDIVVPKTSILAEFPVAVVERNAKRNGTTKLATEYLSYLYSEKAQRLLADFNYRVHHPDVVKDNADRFPEVELLTVEAIAGGWDEAMKTHFASGGKLDQLQRR